MSRRAPSVPLHLSRATNPRPHQESTSSQSPVRGGAAPRAGSKHPASEKPSQAPVFALPSPRFAQDPRNVHHAPPSPASQTFSQLDATTDPNHIRRLLGLLSVHQNRALQQQTGFAPGRESASNRTPASIKRSRRVSYGEIAMEEEEELLAAAHSRRELDDEDDVLGHFLGRAASQDQPASPESSARDLVAAEPSGGLAVLRSSRHKLPRRRLDGGACTGRCPAAGLGACHREPVRQSWGRPSLHQVPAVVRARRVACIAMTQSQPRECMLRVA